MKKFAIIAIISTALLGGAYYYFSGRGYTIKLSESDIKEKIEKKLPITKRFLLIFQVTLDNPRVQLKDGSDKINIGLDAVLNISLDNNTIPVGGTIDLSGGIRYLPELGQFFLTDPVIENLTIQGLPDKHTNRANKVLTAALSEHYRTHPIYTLKATDTKQAAAKMVLKNVTITNRELHITLGI